MAAVERDFAETREKQIRDRPIASRGVTAEGIRTPTPVKDIDKRKALLSKDRSFLLAVSLMAFLSSVEIRTGVTSHGSQDVFECVAAHQQEKAVLASVCSKPNPPFGFESLGRFRLLLRLLRTAKPLALHAPKPCPNSRWGRWLSLEGI